MSHSNKRVIFILFGIILFMSFLVCMSPYLYRTFCQATGYGGTIKRAALSDVMGGKTIRIFFNSDKPDDDMPLRFIHNQRFIDIKAGENKLAYYEAENISDKKVHGMAVYNVVPHKAGRYFSKVKCFCFSKRVFEPRQKFIFPVLFFIDAEIEKDEELRDIDSITLSYAFFEIPEDLEIPDDLYSLDTFVMPKTFQLKNGYMLPDGWIVDK